MFLASDGAGIQDSTRRRSSLFFYPTKPISRSNAFPDSAKSCDSGDILEPAPYLSVGERDQQLHQPRVHRTTTKNGHSINIALYLFSFGFALICSSVTFGGRLPPYHTGTKLPRYKIYVFATITQYLPSDTISRATVTHFSLRDARKPNQDTRTITPPGQQNPNPI